METFPKLSIIVPCYNEEKNIPLILEKFRTILKDQKEIELIFVENGSTDGTAAAIDKEIKNQNCSFARKVTVAQNQGYGFGILSGLRESKAGMLAWTHADLQTDPTDVLKAYVLYKERRLTDCVVKGKRLNRKLGEKFFSFSIELFASLYLGQPLSDINAQPKLFPRRLLELMTNPPYDFSLDLYLLYTALKNNFPILTVPVYFKDRLHEEAKGGAGSFGSRWKLMKRTFKAILDLKK